MTFNLDSSAGIDSAHLNSQTVGSRTFPPLSIYGEKQNGHKKAAIYVLEAHFTLRLKVKSGR